MAHVSVTGVSAHTLDAALSELLAGVEILACILTVFQSVSFSALL